MDHIDETLTTQSQDPSIELSIRAAIGIAKKILNYYYDKTDYSEVYRIAMSYAFSLNLISLLTLISVLHPCHKLKYFENAGWPTDWIKTAEEILRTEFEPSYTKQNQPNKKDDEPPARKKKKVCLICVPAAFADASDR